MRYKCLFAAELISLFIFQVLTKNRKKMTDNTTNFKTRFIWVYQELSNLVVKELGFSESWLVGGLVRDLLLGLEPKDYDIVDYDIVVNIPSISILKKALEDHGYSGYIAGDSKDVKNNLKFEVLKFRINVDGTPEDIDAVIPRTEVYNGVSRKPESVEYAGGLTVEETLKRDSRRRDFTINALYLRLGLDIEKLFSKSFYTNEGTINKEHVSKFVDDPTGGLDLLKVYVNKELKTVLELTNKPRTVFGQDPLRMLRAIRFVATKGCVLSKNLEKALYHNVDKFQVGTLISFERIEQEISKILLRGTSESVIWAFEFMYKSRMLPLFLEELDKTWGFDQQNHHHDLDLWEHSFEVFSIVKNREEEMNGILDRSYSGLFGYKYGLEPDVVTLKDVKGAKIDHPELCLFWAAILHDIAKPETQKFSEEKGEMVYHGHELASAQKAEKILKELKFSNDEAKITAEIIERHMLLKNFSKDTNRGTSVSWKTLKRLRERFIIDFHGYKVDLMVPCLALIIGDDIAKAEPSLNNFKSFKKCWDNLIEEEKSLPPAPRFKIDGQVVMDRYNLKPGTDLGEKIKKIKEHQITSDAQTLEELLDEFDFLQ